MPSPSPSKRQAALRGLTRLSAAELTTVWSKLNTAQPARLAGPLSPVLQALAERYGLAAATLAADWYDESRSDAGASGHFRAIPADLPSAERFEVMARWGVGPLFGDAPNQALALRLLLGGMQRTILGAGRDTTARSVEADPARPRYARHASANACAFCALMASRGPVYRTTRGARAGTEAGTKYHDECHCTTIEVFPGKRYHEAPYVAKWREAYRDSPSTRDLPKVLASMRERLGTN